MAEGAHRAATVADAVAASPVTIVCLNDCPTMYRVFEPAGALSGGTLVSLNSGTPAEARAAAGWAAERDLDYLDVAIMVPLPWPTRPASPLPSSPTSRSAGSCPWSLDPASLAEQAPNLDKGAYPGDLETMRMNLNALEHIARASAEQGVHPAQPQLTKRLAEPAIARGHGTENCFALFEILKNPAAQAP